MTQRRVTSTNQLSTVIDALQLGKKTGLLTLERGEGGTFEEGTITFVHGQIMQAAIGSYSGRDAATKLLSWSACRFSFTPTHPEQITQPSVSMPSRQTDPGITATHISQSFYGARLPEPATYNPMERRPSILIAYHAVESVLRSLEQRGFSRVHRRLFLLIDGRRSVGELASLIGRTPDETYAMLTMMEQAGLIRF